MILQICVAEAARRLPKHLTVAQAVSDKVPALRLLSTKGHPIEQKFAVSPPLFCCFLDSISNLNEVR